MSAVKVASDQPSFLPWAGFFNKMLAVDVLIYNLGVPVSYGAKDHYHNRVRLAGSWLTIGVTKDTRSGLWTDLRIVRDDLPRLAKTIRNVFGKKYPHYHRAWLVAELLERFRGEFLVDLNLKLIDQMLLSLGDRPRIEILRERPNQDLSKTGRLVERIRTFVDGPVDYYMGRGALRYIDVDAMARNDIRVFVQTFSADVKDETALQLIAQVDSPSHDLDRLASWEVAQ